MFDVVETVVFVLSIAALIAAFTYDVAHRQEHRHSERMRRMARRINGDW